MNSTLIQGKTIKRYGKYIILCVLYDSIYSDKEILNKEKYSKIKNILDKIDKTKDIDNIYNEILSSLQLSLPEDLLSQLFYIYKPNPEDLIYKTLNTFCGVRSLKNINDWFDNYRLDGICSSHNMIMYKNYDKPNLYTVDRVSNNNINTNVKIDFQRVRRFLVGSLRSFIISNNLYQSNNEYIIPDKFINKDDKYICDECYLHYPFYYGGAHGWDVLLMKDRSLTLKEIYDFTNRYPSAIVGYILNTSTYQSKSGKHWVSLCFKNKCSYMICSEGSDYFIFMEYLLDNGKRITLNQLLNNYGFGLNYNTKVIQKDNHTCGMFSALSLYLMICYNCNIEKTIEKIGVNASNIVEHKSIEDFVKVFAGN